MISTRTVLRRTWPGLWLWLFVSGCQCEDPPAAGQSEPSSSASVEQTVQARPQLLYLPDGGDVPPPVGAGRRVLLPRSRTGDQCPAEMVNVRGEFCIDRYEAVLVDHASGRTLSPYYAPTRQSALHSYRRWKNEPMTATTAAGRALSVPEPPAWQLTQDVEPRASVRAGAVPNGYVSADLADRACHNAGKRLCQEQEWVMACRGEQNRQFPYGEGYVQGACNVFREAHPAQLLHANASVGHSDPRLNLVKVRGHSLLRPTGATTRCRSQWGQDGIYDMVGNLAEWVADEAGAFLGGFYSRSSREGCDRKVTAHPRQYFDYSLGVRCCRDAA
jgi:sulfatase modifying factor 1